MSRKVSLICLALILLNLNVIYARGRADRIVAVVGDEVILESELHDAIEFVKLMAQTEEADENLRKNVLDELIKNRLILDQAKKESLDVSRAEVEEEVNKNLLALKQKFQTEEQFQNALKKEGISERNLRERYRADVKKQQISQKLLLKKQLTNINITPIEIKKFYEANKDSIARRPGIVTLAHILFMIKPSEQAEQDAQRKISEIYDIIVRGGDFEEVAKSFSDDELTRKQGGYLGKISLEHLQPEVASVVSNMKIGEVSFPFRSRYGYEIIKLLNKKGENIELSHIMIKVLTTRADSIRTKKAAQAIRAKILNGASFDSLATIYSDDPMTKDSSGLLGQFLITGLVEPYRSAIEKLSTGAISEPILSEHGYHLIKVLDKQEEQILSLEEMQDEIRNYLYEEQLKERLENYLSEVAKTTYIEKYLE
ncbi:MAG: peptidylprolyl isomerase [candidate division WOR-3 bacterium]